MSYGIVYAYVNRQNMKMYIGQTTQLMSHRRRDHRQNAFKKRLNRPFYNAIRKYGMSEFEEIILERCNSKTELDASEKNAVRIFETTDISKGYNLMDGGFSNGRHSEETKKKISEASKRMHANPEHKAMLVEVGKKYYRFIDNHESKIKSGLARRKKSLETKNGC